MKKISSKIIISLLLAVLLWGGIGGYPLKKVNAADQSVQPETIMTKADWDAENGYVSTSEQYNAYRRAVLEGNRTLDESIMGNLDMAGQAKKSWKTALDFGAGIFSLPWFAGLATALSAILSTLAGLMSIAAAIFDGVIHLSISGFKSFAESSNITESWTIIRDTINVCFIFILLYIAITTIIGSIGVKTKVQLKNVVVDAMLINFSLFFTKILIDVGNLIATTIYDKLSAASYGTGVWGLTGKILDGLNLAGLWSPELIKISGQTNAIFILVLSIILVCLTLWVFLYGAILFLLRNAMLLFLMAVSPIGFIGGTLPWFEKRASEWWSSLVNQIMVAPFFLFIMYMVIRFVDASPKILKLVETDSYWTGSTGLNYAMYIHASLIIGLLVVGIKTTKKLSGKMGDITEKLMNMGLQAGIAAFTGGASALAARGAALTRRGMNMAAAGASVAARGRARGNLATIATGNRGIAAGQALRNIGSVQQAAGNLFSGQTFRNAAGQPNRLGLALTDARDAFLKSSKKETGIDLESAFKYKDKIDKDYEKRYGDIANKIGGKKEREELDILKNISTNIKTQAENKFKKDPANKAAWDAMEAMTDRKLKKIERDRLNGIIESVHAPVVAREMGVDLAAHNARQDELKIIIEQKTIDKNKYAAGIPDEHKKFANIIRSKATYESKDGLEKGIDEMMKAWLKKNPQTPPTPAP